ncbi:MAG: SH3 domain-containing protein [Anaerolineae bacterium]|nr:SH3 domain-containing protein [Anaerolineae bacterium]
MLRHAALHFACLMLCAAALACNLLGMAETTGTLVPTVTLLIDDGSRPQVVIESPPSGAQVIAGEQLIVQVRAVDSVGITRAELREGERVVVVQPAPDPIREFRALMPYVPKQSGALTLSVVAYRRSVASAPAMLSLQVVTQAGTTQHAAQACTARVNVNNLNLRRGDGTATEILAKLSLGERLSVLGRNGSGTWYRVQRADGLIGWVSAQYIIPEGDCASAPVVQP